jgi:hypothetical protein
MHLRRITARGLPLLPWVVAQALNTHTQDLLLHLGFWDLMLLNQCGWHAILQHCKGNLLALVDNQEAVVGILLLPRGRAIIVADMDISPMSAPLPRKMEETRLPSLLCLLQNFQKMKNAQPPKRGKLNHITAEEANEDDQVLVGMVSLNSINSRAIFDFGASHSFMSRKFSFEHQFPIRKVPISFHIGAPSATLVTHEVVNLAQLEVVGLTFKVNFVVIDLEDFDIIIGMNWMTKHDGVIRCNPRSIELKHPSGSWVVLSLHGKSGPQL